MKKMVDKSLDLPTELKAFFNDTEENVDEAILKFMKSYESIHKLGTPIFCLENYFVHKTLIVGRRRLFSRLESLQNFDLIEKVVYDGFVFYRLVKERKSRKNRECSKNRRL